MKKFIWLFFIIITISLNSSTSYARWIEHQNGTVTDTDTGLMWQQKSGPDVNWDGAMIYCNNSSFAGYHDWRLPHIEELKSIIINGNNSAIDEFIFQIKNGYDYWSETTSSHDPLKAYGVMFLHGNIINIPKNNLAFVRPVRGGDVHEEPNNPCRGLPYRSDSESIQWDCRNEDTFYCIDIFNNSWNLINQAAVCGEEVHSFLPSDLNLPSGDYNWKVWSTSGYGGDGFEGGFTIQGICNGLAYKSDSDSIEWGCRNMDTFYCIDVYDSNWDMLKQAASCGENLHSFSPFVLNLPSGNYNWKVWSSSGYGGDGFDGSFSIQSNCSGLSYNSDSSIIAWGCRNNDTFYCIDIFDGNGNILKQAASCGESLHSFLPSTLNLSSGNYSWKVWSSSGYGGYGFEGSLSIQSACNGLSYKSDLSSIEWGCRNNDTYYCIDIFDNDWDMIKQAASCGESVHSYSPSYLNLSAGSYRWKVWSSTGYGGSGFEGTFQVVNSGGGGEGDGGGDGDI